MSATSADRPVLAFQTLSGLRTDMFCAQAHVCWPFQTPSWLVAWQESYRPSAEDCFTAVIAAPDGGAPLLVLPLVRERRARVDVLTLPDRGVSDYQAPWIRKDFDPAAPAFAGAWRQLLKTLPPADVLLLDKCPTTIAGRPNPLRLLSAVEPSALNRHPLPLDAAFARLVETRFDGSCMRSLAKKRRKLERKGELVFSVGKGAGRLEALEAVLGWRRQRFADSNEPAKLERDHNFYRRLFAQGDIGCMATLTLDGKVIAGCYGTQAGDAVQLLGVAYDEAWKNYSPGMLVMLGAVEWAVHMGLGEFDFTIGDESYKRDFGVLDEALFEVHEPLTLKGRSYLASRSARRLMRDLLHRARLHGAAERTAALAAALRRARPLPAAAGEDGDATTPQAT